MMADKWKPQLDRELVLGYLIIEKKTKTGTYIGTSVITSDVNCDGGINSTNIPFENGVGLDYCPDESVKGILPAQPHTYRVSCEIPIRNTLNGKEFIEYDFIYLGYEHPGIDNRDWFSIVVDKIRCFRDSCNDKKLEDEFNAFLEVLHNSKANMQ